MTPPPSSSCSTQVDQLDQQIGKAEDQAQMIAKIGALAAASTPTGNDSGGPKR